MTMNIDFLYRKKIPVGILGATGIVGQKFVELLTKHPWFALEAVAASENSVGKKYADVVEGTFSKEIGQLVIQKCEPNLECAIVFSALDASVAGPIEEAFADAGYVVISKAKNHRMDRNVPLLVPEVNPEHLAILSQQKYSKKGALIADPNCVVEALVMALKPLVEQFGVEAVQVATMQSLSGAGKNPKLREDIVDNVIPFIADEEEKVETEPLKILGKFENGELIPWDGVISAHCNRVHVSNGHLANVSVKLKQPVDLQDVIEAWAGYEGEPQILALPSAPKKPLIYLKEESYPQPRVHRDLEDGMAVFIGRLRKCPTMSVKFTILSNNVIRGAAGAAILNAELLVKKGLIFW